MGARGPLRIVSALQPVAEVARGTAAAEVAPLAPNKPAMGDELSQLWDEIVPQLDAAGLVSAADGPAVEVCLRHLLLARKAYDQIGGQVVVKDHGHGGVKKHPAEAVFRAESTAFLEYAKQLGMTFVSRARTPAGKAAEGGNNPFASSFG